LLASFAFIDSVKILVLHNNYRVTGGEDRVVEEEQTLLTAHGHKVDRLSFSNYDIQGLAQKIRTGISTCYSLRARHIVKSHLRKYRPDIVHIHNFFPLLTPSVYDACIEEGRPIVQSLHNYRLICANALLYRNGKICEDCLAHPSYKAIVHRCYRHSLLGSATVAGMLAIHRKLQTWNRKVDYFIALSAFAKERFTRFGLTPEKIFIKPNFVNSLPDHLMMDRQRSGALYVGRLSEEKGVSALLNSWQAFREPLTIVGDGPMAGLVGRRKNKNGVYWHGYQHRDAVFAYLQKARFVVVPSQCYENFPLVVAESFASGTPVVAARLGALSEIVRDGQTGLLYEAFDHREMKKVIQWAFDHPTEMALMGKRARKQFDRLYAPSANYHQLMHIYRAARQVNARR
jgi:glycosyltransferase involved in cell wall biosynthesis